MGYRYKQLTLEERCTIARLHEDGQSIRQIAASLDRAPSTVARELKRNTGRQGGYRPAYAAEQAWARRWKGSRMERQPSLREIVLERLAMGYSPEQVAGRLAREQGKHVISHESIYRFIAAQIRRTNDGAWRHYLPKAKNRRGRRSRRGRPCPVPDRTPLQNRPPEVLLRDRPGHWEADLMGFGKGKQVMLIVQERSSRLMMATLQPDKTADKTAKSLCSLFDGLPEKLRLTLTLDNGAEFARHKRLPLKTFFCDPHSPWQKGGIENAIGRLRRYLPRNTDPNTLSQRDAIMIAQLYNHTPRKCLDFKTPAEVFSQLLLHFKCESTPHMRSG